MKILSQKKAEGTYISTVVFVLIAVIFIGLVINLFSIIAAKSQMDAAADQLTRQIQLAGEVSADTDRLFSDITGHIGAAENIRYTVSTHYLTGKKIQLATPFSVTVTGTAYLGGFGDFNIFPINLVSYGAGVSEEYWK
ncbi:MAG: DUF4320 family protein [Clostridiales bacterium]|nr:DUF4320 family protein [Clostridiales bacterium]